MKTLSEIETAAAALSPEDQQALVRYLLTQLDCEGADAGSTPGPSPDDHSVLDIEPVHLGRVLRPLTSDDDLLGEMLEGRA
jgi:hypothetical protein